MRWPTPERPTCVSAASATVRARRWRRVWTASRREYLRAALDAYADGRRHSGIMRAVVTGLDAGTRAALAEAWSAAPDAEPASVAAPPAGG